MSGVDCQTNVAGRERRRLERAERKRKRPAQTALCAPSPTEKKGEVSRENEEVEEPKAKKSKLGNPAVLRETDKNKSLKDQLKQLPRIPKYPPGADRRPNPSAGRRGRGIDSGDPSLRGRTASDRPAGINKRKRVEDVTNDLKPAKLIKTRVSPKPEATARPRVRSNGDEIGRISGQDSPKRKTVKIYRDSPSAVERKQPPAKVKPSTNTASVSAKGLITAKTDADLHQARKHRTKPAVGTDFGEKKGALTQVGEVSLTNDNVAKSPRKVPKKVEPEAERDLAKNILDEEAQKKSSQNEILSKTELEVGQIQSESLPPKAKTLTPSQKKVSSDSKRENKSMREEPGAVEATTGINLDEPLTKATGSTAGPVSSHKEAPTVARIGHPGLINDGNSCYQNTAFQMLANTRPFADHVKVTRWADKETPALMNLNIVFKRGTARGLKRVRSKARKTCGSSKSVASRLSKLFKSMHSQLDSGYVIDPGVATEAMSNLEGDQVYSGEQQQDAGEFLAHLIDRVVAEEESLLQSKSEATEVRRLFRGKEEQRIICSGCDHVSAQTHPLCALTLDVPEDKKPVTVEALLKNYSSTVRLPEDHKCEECHKAGKTRKALQITETPPYLIVMLNRTKIHFDKYSRVKIEKKKTSVPIPKEIIDLSDCCALKDASDKTLYAVRGVGIHKGNSASAGHYIAVCKGADNKWREFNDEAVRELTAADFADYDQNTQMLLLERQD
ncbi:MAG: Ubiquitin carboxyl-terminal hydrolase 46 [Heterodermia speciosa]|uniref:ubiquitinyl hydrolase 1 n=1 Tax=Heterodermia speciosa TaxID=116794 RepID=A0A8H3PIG2_9LECA|nr:MAG: Ubiquitin carboxyl-terminal hydrolase 46 [Heterodermia speciosa]